MKRLALLAVTIVIIAGLVVIEAAAPYRGAITFVLEAGTEQSFPATILVPGDRFSCHGALISVQNQPRGIGWTSSTGMAAGTDADGDVAIRCPDEIAPI